jgi:hypothetical protein
MSRQLQPAAHGLMFACLLVMALPGTVSAQSWRWALGAQLDSAPHAIVDLGYRHGNLSLQWLTDTLDMRYHENSTHGEWQVGLRGALFGAELLFSPWKNGQPAPEDALRATYLGLDASRAWWFKGGFHAGVFAEMRFYNFGPWFDSKATVPASRGRLKSALKVGVWRDELQTEIWAGYVREGETDGAWVAWELTIPHGDGVGLWNYTAAGWSAGLTRVSKFRLGGLNPYVIPFAGLGWAQHWVEHYLVQRLGMVYRSKSYDFEVGLGGDLGVWDESEPMVSVLVMAQTKLAGHLFSVAAGVHAVSDGEVGLHGWSAFLYYEKPWL